MSFGTQLKARREALGLSRGALAGRLGVSASAIGNYETGVSFPKEDVLLRLFDALRAEPNTLFYGSYRTSSLDLTPTERELIEKCRSLSPLGRRTVRDAGVSIATVSRVVNDSPRVSEKTKQKVLEVMKKNDYTPNVFAPMRRKMQYQSL